MSGRPNRKRMAALLALLVLAPVLALLVWKGRALQARAQLGAAYGARIGCSCRYVEGRELASCRDDKEPGMAIVTLADQPEERAVRARVPLLASRVARHRPGWGCILDPAG